MVLMGRNVIGWKGSSVIEVVLAGWLARSLAGSLARWLDRSLAGWLARWLARWLAGWLAGRDAGDVDVFFFSFFVFFFLSAASSDDGELSVVGGC